MTVTGCPYRDAADLAAMQAALSASWKLARPLVNATPGDLEWWVVSAQPGTVLTDTVRLWEDAGEVLAWAWFNVPGELDWHLRADLRPAVRRAIVEEAVAWATERACVAAEQAGLPAPAELQAWAMDTDEPLRGLLAALGWRPAPEPAFTHWYRRLDGEIARPVVPAGYRLRHIEVPADLPARVEVHRAAFAPSRMTIERYEALVRMPHYAPQRDLVVEAPDGSFAAFTMAWYDPAARIGEFEPVGTHPDHRRRGLAQAVNLFGLHALRAAGALDCLVFSACSNEASEALYASVGFAAVTRHRAWLRTLR